MDLRLTRLCRLGIAIVLAAIVVSLLLTGLSRPTLSFAQVPPGVPAITATSSQYAVVQHNGVPLTPTITITLTNFAPNEQITLTLNGGVNATFPGVPVPPALGVAALPAIITRVVTADATGTAIVAQRISSTIPTDIYWFDAVGSVSGAIPVPGLPLGAGLPYLTPLLVVERTREVALTPGYSLTVHYAVNFFNAIVGQIFAGDPAWATAEDMAEDFAIFALPASALTPTAQLNDVLWLDYRFPEWPLEDEMSAQIIAGQYNPLARGYERWLATMGVSGADVTVALIDTGYDTGDNNTAHPDVRGRLIPVVTTAGAPIEILTVMAPMSEALSPATPPLQIPGHARERELANLPLADLQQEATR